MNNFHIQWVYYNPNLFSDFSRSTLSGRFTTIKMPSWYSIITIFKTGLETSLDKNFIVLD
jgi:hypothetical protein